MTDKPRPLTLATAVVLLVGGGVERARSEGDTGAALLAAGLVTLGVWLTMEVLSYRRRGDHDEP